MIDKGEQFQIFLLLRITHNTTTISRVFIGSRKGESKTVMLVFRRETNVRHISQGG